MKFKKLLLAGAALGLLSGMSAMAKAPAKASTEDEVILHAWSWSLDTIAANMEKIADAGYAYVQTSPVQTCFVGDGGGMALFSQPGDSVQGKWYYYYQPTDWKIGNYMLGDREDFKAMCDSAYKYGVKVIVDVLPNHTAIDHTAVLPSLDAAVGGHENLFHANGFTPITKWDDRMECTTGQMGGLPDVNTENPDFQYYYLQYVNDLINLGARGFRYDTAKHIGVHSDPLDPKVAANGWTNNFWDVATGREAVKGLSLLMPDSLFIYGEVLQDKGVPEAEYAEYMDMTASAYGHVLREALEKGAFSENLLDWYHEAPDHLVTWVESHDTYANAHESAGLTDDQIRAAWAFLAARQNGRPLFFSRPAGSTRENYWGNNRIGARGNDEFFAPEVVAVNKFKKAMAGEPEHIFFSKNNTVAEVARGEKGAVLVNFSTKEQKFKMETTLPEGTYTDGVSGASFKSKNGFIEGKLPALGTAVLMM